MMSSVQTAVTRPGPSNAAMSVDLVFRQIRDLVYRACGIYQTEDKLYLLQAACVRRMKQLAIISGGEYWQVLTSHPKRDAEMRELLNEITIGETCLFRNQPQLDAVRQIILPELVAEKSRQTIKRLRIWSAGCSTGEEAYSLAMTMLEEKERLLNGWTVEVIATDLNDRSIEAAKAGIYGDYALRFTSEYFRQKYFSQTDEKKLQVQPQVKKLIAFSRLNLQDDSQMLFMKSMDIIFCCNVLIYFDQASKSNLVGHFLSSINFGGYLFLGPSESLQKLNENFHLVHFPSAIAYWKPSLKSDKL